MKVTIMGAGMSGLSRAITLEKHGITPTIFEKRSRGGDRFVNGGAMFSLLNRPVKNCIHYISEKLGIELKPLTIVNKLIIHSKNETSTIDGKLGYSNIRGRHEDSYENQLARQVKTDIIFNSKYEYTELVKEFDCVMLAAGDGIYASHQGNFNSDVTFTARGVTVEGDFKLDEIHAWFIYELMPKHLSSSKSPYGILKAYSNKETRGFTFAKWLKMLLLLVRIIVEQLYKMVVSFIHILAN